MKADSEDENGEGKGTDSSDTSVNEEESETGNGGMNYLNNTYKFYLSSFGELYGSCCIRKNMYQ